MKLLAYAIFAVSVLLFSGFARASVAMPFVNASSYQTPTHIEQVAFQDDAKQMILAGNLPNPCVALPSASLTQDQKDPRVLTLRLTSPMSTDICIDRIEPYTTALDLPTLARASRLNIDRQQTYVIQTEDSVLKVVSGSMFVR